MNPLRNSTGANRTAAYISGVELNGEGDTQVLALCAAVSASFILLFIIAFSCVRKHLIVAYSKAGSPESVAGCGYFDWMIKAATVTEEEILDAAGLDGWTLVEFNGVNMRMFLVLSIVIMPILCPLHWQGHDYSQQPDILSRLDIGNMKTNDHTNRFWVHTALVWIVVIVTMSFLQRAQRDLAEKRRLWLSKMPRPRSCTLLVENIPEELRNDAKLERYFDELFPDAIERTYVCRFTDAIKKAEKLLHDATFKVHLAEARYDYMGQRPRDMNALESCKAEQQEATLRLERERKRVEMGAQDGDPLALSSAGFVTFDTRIARRFAMDSRYTDDPMAFQVQLAPDPKDVLFSDITASQASKSASHLMGCFCLGALFVFWSPIVVFISGLTDLASVQKMFPVVKKICDESPLLNVILGQLLTTLALKLFMWFLPGILFSIIVKFFSHKSGTDVQVTMVRWYFYFLFIFVVLVTLVGRSLVITLIAIMEHPTQIFGLLAASMPGTSHFYLGYMVLAWPFPAFPLLRFMVCVKYVVFRYWNKLSPDLAKKYAEPEDEAYNGMGSRMGVAVLKTTIALSLCTCCPIISFITCIYFAVARFVTGYLLVYMECKKPDLGGVMGMEALHQSMYGLVLYVFLMVGVLLKQAESPGPPLVAVFALWPLIEGWKQFNSRSWETLTLEREVVESRLPRVEAPTEVYVQPECNSDVPAGQRKPVTVKKAKEKAVPSTDLLTERIAKESQAA